MSYFIYLFLTIITYLLMELSTWIIHKFVMHGFLRYLHEDHYQPKYKHPFEKNDLFFVIGAVPSVLLFYFGVNPYFNYKFLLG